MALSTDDVIAIQQLAARYNHAVDAGDGAAFAATFVPEGALVAHERIEGRDALTAFATAVPVGLPHSRHVLTNTIVEGDGDVATLRGYLQVFSPGADGGTPVVRTSGTYSDTLRRDSGGWLFVERVFSAD